MGKKVNNQTPEPEVTEVAPKTKFDIFKDNLKIQKQISPALRKVKVAIRAIENMQKKEIIKDYNDKLIQANILFKELETRLEGMIPG